MIPDDADAERPSLAPTLVFIVPRLARGGTLSVMEAAWAHLRRPPHRRRDAGALDGERAARDGAAASGVRRPAPIPRRLDLRVARRARGGVASRGRARGEVILVPAGCARHRSRSGAGRPSNADAGRRHGPRQRDRLSDGVLLAGAHVAVTARRADPRAASPRLAADPPPHHASRRGPRAPAESRGGRAIRGRRRPARTHRAIPRAARPGSIPSPGPGAAAGHPRAPGRGRRRGPRAVDRPSHAREGARRPRRLGRGSPGRTPPDPGDRRQRTAADGHRTSCGRARDRRPHAR